MTGPKLNQLEERPLPTPGPGGRVEFYERMTNDFVESCTVCGLCLEECPLFPVSKFAADGSQAVWDSMMRLLEHGEDSEQAREMLVTCSWGCNTCVSACPQGLVPRFAHMLAVAKLVNAGKDPKLVSPTTGNRYSLPRVLHAIQVKPSEMRWIKIAPPSPEPVDVVFWASCSGTNHPNVLLDTVAVLDRMGISYVALGGGEICCGLSAIMRGDLEGIARLGEQWIANIAAFHPQKVLFLCQGCQARCKGVIPGLPSPLPFDYAWLPEFLVENVDKIPFTHQVNKIVAVHDSCGVTSLGTYEVTRELLRAIPGVTLVELQHNRENNLCCGGVAAHYRPQLAEGMRRAALREADAAGADVLATTCIGCNLTYLPLEDQYRCKVQNFISLVAEGVGVHNEDRFKKYLKCRNPEELLASAREYIEASEFSVEEMQQVLPAIFDHLKALS